jgi:hypothetical protein
MAVVLERMHAEFVGQGEGLAVVAEGGLDRWGRLARRALAQEPQRPGLGAALRVLAGEITCLLSARGARRGIAALSLPQPGRCVKGNQG